MNENKFTPRAEEALRLSQEAAGELGHGYVGTEHLLLGLIREDEGLAHTVLIEAGLTDDMIVEIIKKSVGVGLPGSNPAQGLTPRAKRVVEIAKLKTANMGEEDTIKKAYVEIGKLYYAEKGQSPEGAYAAACEKITAAKAAIEANNDRIAALKDSGDDDAEVVAEAKAVVVDDGEATAEDFADEVKEVVADVKDAVETVVDDIKEEVKDVIYEIKE